MLIWSKEAFISALGLSLAHSLWQGALVGAVAVALHSRLKRATADVRYAACGLLLLTLVIAWLCSLACLYAAEAHATAPPVAVHQFLALSTMPAAASDPLSSDLQTRTLRSFAPSLVLLWTLGVSLLSLRHLSSLLALRRLQRVGTMPCPPEWQARIKSLAVRMGLRREVRVRLSTRVDVPLTFGVLKSYLLLPPSTLMGLRTEQLEALIAHELAHIRQHDSLVNILQIYAETILFYHPTVWWLSAQMRVAREQRCDDLAVRIVGDHALYARALLTMEELRAPIPHLALGATGGNSHMSNHHLIQRIQRVLGARGPEKRPPWLAGTLALCTASIGLATLWPVHAHSAPHPAEAKQTDGQQTGTTITQSDYSFGLDTSVNGKSIGLTIDSKDFTPETPITVDGQKKRFGDLSADDQKQIRRIVADALKNWHTNWHLRFGTSVNGKTIGLTIDSKTPDLTPETLITVDGQQKRFGDLIADDQKQIRIVWAVARKSMPPPPGAPHPVEAKRTVGQQTVTTSTNKGFPISFGTSVNGKSIGLTIDSKTSDLTPETLITVDGQQKRFGDLSADDQKQIRIVAAAALKNWHANWQIGLGTSVNGKSVGLTIGAKTPDLTPETPITVDGQQKRFGDMSTDDQEQIRRIVADTRKEMDPTP